MFSFGVLLFLLMHSQQNCGQATMEILGVTENVMEDENVIVDNSTTMIMVESSSNIVNVPDMLNSTTCVIPNVDPNSMPSTEAFDVVGQVDDCASKCSASTQFVCQAYTFAGPGTYCILHGAIDIGRITFLDNSPYSITDVACTQSGTSKLKNCKFINPVEISGVKIDITQDQMLPPNSEVLRTMNLGDCELHCELNYGMFNSKCTSFAYNSTFDGVQNQTPNCVIMSRNRTAMKTFAPGYYQLYENPCYLDDFNNNVSKK